MNVLYLCTYYHRAMIFFDSKEALKQYDCNVDVFNAVGKKEIIDDRYKNIMDDSVYHVKIFTKIDRFLYFFKQNKYMKSLLKNIDISKYNLFHSHSLFNGGYVAYKLKKKFGINYIISIRNTDMSIFLKIPFFKKIARKIIKKADGVQFLSYTYKDKFLSKVYNNKEINSIDKKIIVVPNGIEKFWIDSKSTKRTNTTFSTIRLLTVAKVNNNKNIKTVLKVVNKMNEMGYKVKYTVVGKVYSHKIKQLIDQNEYAKHIEFMNQLSLINIYREHDIFVLPSIHETFGRVYLEAMSQGLPVIYSKGQGFDGWFDDGIIGYRVPPKDVTYIIQTLEKVISNYSTISNNCVKKVNYFNWKSLTNSIYLFYDKIVKENKL